MEQKKTQTKPEPKYKHLQLHFVVTYLWGQWAGAATESLAVTPVAHPSSHETDMAVDGACAGRAGHWLSGGRLLEDGWL